MTKKKKPNRLKDNSTYIYGVVNKIVNGSYFLKDDEGREVKAYLSGNIKRCRIKITIHDRVRVVVDKSDFSTGRIVWRCNEGEKN